MSFGFPPINDICTYIPSYRYSIELQDNQTESRHIEEYSNWINSIDNVIHMYARADVDLETRLNYAAEML